MSSSIKPVALRCSFSRGAFSDERQFEVQTSSGARYIGLSSRLHCWTSHGKQLPVSEPQVGQRTIEGFVSAIKLGESEGSAVVHVPDGEVITVPVQVVANRPGGDHVPL